MLVDLLSKRTSFSQAHCLVAVDFVDHDEAKAFLDAFETTAPETKLLKDLINTYYPISRISLSRVELPEIDPDDVKIHRWQARFILPNPYDAKDVYKRFQWLEKNYATVPADSEKSSRD